MYRKDFEIRWSDVDANRHMANTAYISFISHTRIAFLLQLGFDQKMFEVNQIGPVAFYEHVYYFKEAFLGQTIRVSLEIMGMSEDAKFYEFHHNFYNHKGENIALCEMMGSWINLKTRKLTGLNNELLKTFSGVEKADGFTVLTKEDTRKFAKVPQDL